MEEKKGERGEERRKPFSPSFSPELRRMRATGAKKERKEEEEQFSQERMAGKEERIERNGR